MRMYVTALFGLGLAFGVVGHASATIFDSANGTATLPGTNVGTVGSDPSDVTQIGDLALYNSGSGGSYVNSGNNPSNYEFYFAGGSALTIQEEIGNNGIGDAIDAELDSYSNSTATMLDSIQIPFSSGPSQEYTLASNAALGAGYYVISTYLAAGNVTDPNYQINFSTTASVAVPEPSSLFLLAVPLLGVAWLTRARAKA